MSKVMWESPAGDRYRVEACWWDEADPVWEFECAFSTLDRAIGFASDEASSHPQWRYRVIDTEAEEES